MQNVTKILTLLLLTLLGVSCNDHQAVDPAAATCRLTEINGAYFDGLKSTFEYDANGRVSRQVRQFDKLTFEYKHTYDASGRLSESIIIDFDSTGKKGDEALEKYIWINGRITQFQWAYQSGLKGVNNLTYDAQGRLIGFTTETENDPTYDSKWTYTYDDNGVVTRRLLTSLDGTEGIFEARLTYTTKEIVKTAFSLMPKAGQPVDPLLARPWESNYPKNDGVLAYYEPDANGKMEVFAKGTIKNMTFNQSGIATGWSYGDVVGDFTPVTFRVDGCP
jgi:YD repeat-containing protein